MKRKKYKPTFIGKIESYQGESIEAKCAKLIENNEPITDGAPIIYTEKKDGVQPQYDIRTDKWEIALQAMDLANQSKIAKSKGLKPVEKKEDTSTETAGGTGEQQKTE